MKAPQVPLAPNLHSVCRLTAFKRLVASGAAALLMQGAGAQVVPTSPVPAASANSPVTGAVASKAAQARPAARSGPAWAELTARQRESLRPLAGHWDGISEGQKRKWLELSRTYPTLPPADQATMHSRMTEWVGLSSQQRAQARLNFAKTKELSKELTPEQKKAKWQTYQSLSVEEKQKLASGASPKPNSAATAVKPVAPQKLTALPPREPASKARAPGAPAGAIAAPAAGQTAPVMPATPPKMRP